MHYTDIPFAASVSPISSPDDDSAVVWPARFFSPRHASSGRGNTGCHLPGMPTVATCGFVASCRRPVCAQSDLISPCSRQAFA